VAYFNELFHRLPEEAEIKIEISFQNGSLHLCSLTSLVRLDLAVNKDEVLLPSCLDITKDQFSSVILSALHDVCEIDVFEYMSARFNGETIRWNLIIFGVDITPWKDTSESYIFNFLLSVIPIQWEHKLVRHSLSIYLSVKCITTKLRLHEFCFRFRLDSD
jgi:hypothetical protein